MFSFKKHLFILICYNLVNFQVFADDSDVLVSIDSGILRGLNREFYYSFEGIPYAEPPVGELRFQVSVLYERKWNGIRNATVPAPLCLQWSHLQSPPNRLIGDEDCLYLNVYTPTLDGKKEKLPVLINIHGGAFMFGEPAYGADVILKQNMILVSFTYRVGPLGFLSTEDDVISGNFGLKDQLLVLKWVQKNIENFGGDLDRVTLSGFSAGGASAHLHMLSPSSYGLFKNVMAQSGSALNPWVFQEKAKAKAFKIGENLDCSVQNSVKLLKCLREKSANEIVEQVQIFLDYLYNPFSPFGVVVEAEGPNNFQPFLAKNPIEIMKSGNFYKVPVIFSAAEDEGLYPSAEFVSDLSYLQEIEESWNHLLPSILDYKSSVSAESLDEISIIIRQHYMEDRRLNFDTFKQFNKIVNDRLFLYGIGRAAKLMQPHTKTYLYFYRFKAKYCVAQLGSHGIEDLGVAHGDDICIIFNWKIREEIPLTPDETLMAENLAQYYYDFASTSSARFNDIDIMPLDCDSHVKYLEILNPRECYTKISENFGNASFWSTLSTKFNEH
uniref:Carboxylic ester hydrolase n=1 Tax=Corethrella appendiculata TaxID=1370023 RepID=U5EXE1_9DIPT